MFEGLGSYEQVEGFEKQAEELRQRLLKNRYFISLPEKQRKELLKSKKHYLYSQDELIRRMGENPNTFRIGYEFLSAQVHTLPLGFYRTGDKNRGRGLENPVGRRYICLILDDVRLYVLRGIRELIVLFPDIRQKISQADRNVIDEHQAETHEPKSDCTQSTSSPSIHERPLEKERKVGRNDTCPCGSQKKFKKCCGK
jgi:hypothetical protein